jgi:cytochrome c
MFTLRVAALTTVIALGSAGAFAEGPNLGKPVSSAEIASWDISILPDGTGLPPGSGTPAQGARIYAERCAACHGEKGEGRPPAYSRLVGGGPISSVNAAEKTIANFYPYATTVFDFIRRAMPWAQPRSLTNDEVYSVVAYIFAENKLIGESDVMNAQTLPKVHMPNRNGFVARFPERM